MMKIMSMKTIEESNYIDVNVLWFDVRKILEWGNDPEKVQMIILRLYLMIKI